MSAQNRYGYSTPIGSAGGIVDLAPYAIDTFLNEEENGVMKFGLGVVKGSNPGVNIALPTEAATAGDFEGITTNNRTTEYDMDGNLAIRKGVSVGVMRYGRIYGRVVDGVEIAYGDPVYLITSGDNAGMFTNLAALQKPSRRLRIQRMGRTRHRPLHGPRNEDVYPHQSKNRVQAGIGNSL